MEENQKEVTKSTILKHYLSSLLVYGIVLLFISFCPAFRENVGDNGFNYITFFVIYYICYAFFALPIFFKTKPVSILNSKNVAILEYVKKQFTKTSTPEERLKVLEPNEFEKQSMVELFVKSFFGVYCINLICTKYLPTFDYNISFLKEMFSQAITYAASGQGLFMGLIQYIDDTSDMWLTLIFMLTIIIFAISYLSDLNLFRNKIKSVDTTPLGIISCIICFYPFTILTNSLVKSYTEGSIPVENLALRIILDVISVVANLVILISVARLGTKSGNLTNRGIVKDFPYNIVRHPNYIMQVVYIIATTIPIYFVSDLSVLGKIVLTFGMFAWILIFYLRAITEERHLLKDSEYQKYTEEVKYRFIPNLF